MRTPADLSLLATRLHERQAYQAVLVRRLALHELDATQVSGLAEALTNAQPLADKLVDVVTSTVAEREAV